MKNNIVAILIFILPFFTFSQKKAKIFFYHFDLARVEAQSISEIEEKLNSRLSAYEEQLLSLIENKSRIMTEFKAKESKNLLSANGKKFYQGKISEVEDEIFALESDIGMKLQSEISEFQEKVIEYFAEKARLFCEKEGIKVFLAYEIVAQYGYINEKYDRTDEFIKFLNLEKNGFHSAKK